jgi:hypothetical protein
MAQRARLGTLRNSTRTRLAATIGASGMALIVAGAPLPSYGEDVARALQEIIDTADRLCGNVATSGQANAARGAGEVKAELNGLVKRLADIGISASGEKSSTSYEGVVQQELTTALRDVRECKLKIFNVLQEKLLPQVTPAAPVATQPPAAQQALPAPASASPGPAVQPAPTVASIGPPAVASTPPFGANAPQRTLWNHNGSVMYLVANGASREFYYDQPRPGMVEAGARPGSLLFRGQYIDGQYVGTAYIFNRTCGQFAYEVGGPVLDGYRRVLMRGNAPRVDSNCKVFDHVADALEFSLIP